VSLMTEVGTDEFRERLDVLRMLRSGWQKGEKMAVLSVSYVDSDPIPGSSQAASQVTAVAEFTDEIKPSPGNFLQDMCVTVKLICSQ